MTYTIRLHFVENFVTKPLLAFINVFETLLIDYNSHEHFTSNNF